MRQHPAIILWTHKTYLDGMVAPKVLYDNDFPLPHMFAGGNMGFAGLGFLLRRAGGIFIRRSFQDNPLYKLTLRHYIGYLMEKRFPMHWAFEGTRSRLGKLMPPRYGLLKYVLIELAMLKASESQGDGDAVAVFWAEVDRLRALFKFEFFYSPTEAFHQQIRQELARSCPDWETELQRGGGAGNAILEQLQPLIAHTALLTYVEAYMVVVELLARREVDASLDEKTCVREALKYGRQAYLQRRISSEASIGKILFQNGYKLLAHLGLTKAGGEDSGHARQRMVREFRELSRWLDTTKASANVWRAAQLERN